VNVASAFFKAAKMADWFKAGGAKYRTVPDQIDRLPRGKRHRATEAFKCVMRFVASGELDPLRATNPAMAAEAGWSETFMKDGLRLLAEPYELVETERGVERIPLPPLIVRERQQGRRMILPGIGLAKGGTSPAPDPPSTPLGEIQETTTTGEASSSSPQRPAEETAPAGEVPAAELAGLVARARELLNGVTPELVAFDVADHGADRFSEGLEIMARRNRKPGKARKGYDYFRGILRTRKAEGYPPLPAPEPSAVPQAAPARVKAVPSLLSAEAVAELVEACRTAPSPAIAKIARANLRAALADGSIDPEIAATIPADLLEPDPRAP
jgi:hypothetical protein